MIRRLALNWGVLPVRHDNGGSDSQKVEAAISWAKGSSSAGAAAEGAAAEGGSPRMSESFCSRAPTSPGGASPPGGAGGVVGAGPEAVGLRSLACRCRCSVSTCASAPAGGPSLSLRRYGQPVAVLAGSLESQVNPPAVTPVTSVV